MRILIDACLPVELKSLLRGEEVRTAREMGWQRLDNGQLLAKASVRFDVLVTVDKSMPSQQMLKRYAVGVVVIKARSNRIADLKPLLPEIQSSIAHCKPGTATGVPKK